MVEVALMFLCTVVSCWCSPSGWWYAGVNRQDGVVQNQHVMMVPCNGGGEAAVWM